jgi:hypothetical protein
MARARRTAKPQLDEELNSLRELQTAIQEAVQDYVQLEQDAEEELIASWMFTPDRPGLFVVREYPDGRCLVVSGRGIAPVAQG